ARPAAEPVDIAQVVRQMSALLGPVARADGKQLDIDGDGHGAFDALAATSARGSAVRLAIGTGLLAAVDSSTSVCCRPMLGLAGPGIRIESRDHAAIAVDPAVMDALTGDTGIRIDAEPKAISISFSSSPSGGSEGSRSL